MAVHPNASANCDGEQHEAIVVGAGPTGLSAAAALQSSSFETVVLESADAVGARWRPRYEELRLNSWRVMPNLQGLRMPRSFGRYPTRDDFVRYLEEYTPHHRLRIRFDTKLIRVDQAGDLWRLTTSTGTLLARTLVIATGWDAVPVFPDWPGRTFFAAELIHSSEVRSARAYSDREVLVVGAGNSGIDIAGHLIAAGAHVAMSMRTPPNLAKRDLLGIPGQPLLVFGADHLPNRLADIEFTIVQRLLFGDLAHLGLPRSREGVYANFHRRLRNPAIDDGFIDALKKGRTQIVAEVERLEGSEVVLVDGSRLRPNWSSARPDTGAVSSRSSAIWGCFVQMVCLSPTTGLRNISPRWACISQACGDSSAARFVSVQSKLGASCDPPLAVASATTGRGCRQVSRDRELGACLAGASMVSALSAKAPDTTTPSIAADVSPRGWKPGLGPGNWGWCSIAVVVAHYIVA